MTNENSRTVLTDDTDLEADRSHVDPTTVGRRGLLRRAAVVAGVGVGAAAALTALPGTAVAADGDGMELGSSNAADSTTSLTIGGADGGAAPALSLENAAGPSLKLQPLSAAWGGQLEVGEMVGTDLGPLVGVDLPGGLTTTYLVTGTDLATVPTPFASSPARKLDLRTSDGRSSIVRRSAPDALTTTGKLRAGQWIDIGLAVTGDDYALQAVFANLTVTDAATTGWAALYPPGVRPNASTINYARNQPLANFAFVATGVLQGYHTVRLYTTAEAWFVLDVSGGITVGNSVTPLAQAARAKGGRLALIDKVRRVLSAQRR